MNERSAAVLIARHGKGWRWYPNPESRKSGSQRYILPSVDRWHVAASWEAIPGHSQGTRVEAS